MAASPTTAKVVAAVAAVGVVTIVGAVVLLGGSHDSDDGARLPTPLVTSTPAVTVSPAVTATPGAGSLSPREQAEVFALEPLPGVVEPVRIAAAETVAENYGFYFMNVETGAVDGWRHVENDPLPNPLGFSGDYRFAGFSYRASLEPAVRRAKLADRKTGALYGWQGDAELVYAEGNLRNVRRGEAGSSGEVLASSGDRVLFRIKDPENDDWFIVVAMDPEPAVVSTFQADGYMALLSTDARQAVVFGESTWLVDIDNGTVQSLAVDIRGFDGAFALRNIPGAGAFLLSISATDPDREGAWLR